MAMSNFEDTLITLDLEMMVILLKMWLFLIIVSTTSAVKNIDDGLQFLFSFLFTYLSFSFIVYFLFLELGLGYSDKDHAVT